VIDTVSGAVVCAAQEVRSRGLVPYRLTLHPSAHRELIKEMGEPEGSTLCYIGGMDVEQDTNSPEQTVYVDGRGTT